MRFAFTVNGEPRELDAPPLRRLLDILRDDLGLTGTKEGCGEGECGACAVLLDGTLVQSCLIPAGQLPGRHIVTIEALGSEAEPDPVQQSFLDEGAVQCGFCIPGMVLATHALLARNPRPDDEGIREALSGNICRCTGYERIVRAVRRAAGLVPSGTWIAKGMAPDRVVRASATDRSATMRRDASSERTYLSPTSLEEALATLQVHASEGTVLAGGTDLMLPDTSTSLATRFVLDISRVNNLAGVRVYDDAVELGAATSVATLADDPVVARHLSALGEAARLFGAPAIRNRATIGGNLAGASPAADLPPALLALGAMVVLESASGRREVPLELFYTGYRRTERRAEELIVMVRVPLPKPKTRQAFFKAGTRRAQSIARASLAGAARVAADGTIRDVRIAAGSVAPVPVLLAETMRFLEGRRIDAALSAEADHRAAVEISPIDDVRSNVAYRRFVTGRFVARFLRECAQE